MIFKVFFIFIVCIATGICYPGRGRFKPPMPEYIPNDDREYFPLNFPGSNQPCGITPRGYQCFGKKPSTIPPDYLDGPPGLSSSYIPSEQRPVFQPGYPNQLARNPYQPQEEAPNFYNHLRNTYPWSYPYQKQPYYIQWQTETPYYDRNYFSPNLPRPNKPCEIMPPGYPCFGKKPSIIPHYYSYDMQGLWPSYDADQKNLIFHPGYPIQQARPPYQPQEEPPEFPNQLWNIYPTPYPDQQQPPSEQWEEEMPDDPDYFFPNFEEEDEPPADPDQKPPNEQKKKFKPYIRPNQDDINPYQPRPLEGGFMIPIKPLLAAKKY